MANTPDLPRDTCDVPCLHPEIVRAARGSLLSTDDTESLATIFGVLADPTRLRMVHALSEHELCVCDLANVLGMRQAAVSHQLRLLRALRVVRVRRAGRNAFYSLDDAHIRGLLAVAVAHVREEPAIHRVASVA